MGRQLQRLQIIWGTGVVGSFKCSIKEHRSISVHTLGNFQNNFKHCVHPSKLLK